MQRKGDAGLCIPALYMNMDRMHEEKREGRKAPQTAEILAVGTELLLGHTINTDAALVARELNSLGISVLYSTVVGDNPQRLADAMGTALKRSDLVVTTGGLGPTGDDLTKETVAAAAGRRLVLHEESKRRIEAYFKGRECGESQFRQAMLPEGCQVFPNDFGTAPGCAFYSENGSLVMMFPGPPSELIPMLKQYGVPYLKRFSEGVILSRMMRVFGMGEGAAAERIADLTESENPTAATYAKENEMFIRVTARAASEAEAESLCEPMIREIRRRLGDVIYTVNEDGTSDSCLENTVVALLKEKGWTFGAAESCTGGLLAKRITDVPGASDVLRLSMVTYANEAKAQFLGVPEETLRDYGAVSFQTAKAMAEGIRLAAGADLGIGITGVAGPGGGTPEKPVGLVFIALCDGEHTWVRRMDPPGRVKSRESLRIRASSIALDMMRRRVEGLSQEPAEIFEASVPQGVAAALASLK